MWASGLEVGDHFYLVNSFAPEVVRVVDAVRETPRGRELDTHSVTGDRAGTISNANGGDALVYRLDPVPDGAVGLLDLVESLGKHQSITFWSDGSGTLYS